MSTDPHPTQRWRFTLRETMIAMVAIAAILALIVKSRGLSTTSFFRSFEGGAYLEAACQRADVSLEWIPNATNVSLRDSVAVKRYGVSMSVPPGSAPKIVEALRTEIHQGIQQHGCRIRGEGLGGDPLTSFDFDYASLLTQGDIYVYSLSQRPDKLELRILLHEY